MNPNKREFLFRSIAVTVLFIALCVIYAGRLVYLQVSGQDYYTMARQTETVTREVPIKAQRGEIFDRNGKALVTNVYSYDLQLDYGSMPDENAEKNDLLLTLLSSVRRNGLASHLRTPDALYTVTAVDSSLLFSKDASYEGTAKSARLAKLVTELNADPDDDETSAAALLLHYGITAVETGKNGEKSVRYLYPMDDARDLFLYRLDIDLSNFSAAEPYTLATDASLSCLTDCEELAPRGIRIFVSASRRYNYPGYASHILGTVGAILSDNVAYYTELGYPLNAIVGRDGVERTFESWLHGTDGVLTVTEDTYGNILQTEVTKEPIAGKDVYLTIDIEMQMEAEKALAENIFKIRREAIESGKPLTGEDASAGALTAVDCDTGEVLAICSYPTYNLATYSQDFDLLRNDETKPLVNRALSGLYAPGSTFKVGVAVAALDAGIIEPDTIIDAQGQYTYYEGYQPRCWLYLTTGRVHGPINVVEAIQESCNYFFYDVGRRLTIEKMNEYMRHFGLGQPTGIELSEGTGILAGPDYRNEQGLDKWNPGDTLQAAIGQSDNLFTPLQITMYITDILNSGVRYTAHLLYQVREYGSGEIVYRQQPEVIDEVKIDPDILAVVKEGMKNVMDNGSAASVFRGYAIPVGGKTGTAQVSETKSDNGVITVFAPFEDPELVVTCVIEQGAGGTDAGYAVRDVLDYYFDVNADEGE